MFTVNICEIGVLKQQGGSMEVTLEELKDLVNGIDDGVILSVTETKEALNDQEKEKMESIMAPAEKMYREAGYDSNDE